MKSRFLTTVAFFAAATALACTLPVLADDFGRDRDHGRDHNQDRDHHRHPHDIHTETPIKHLVIIFNENRSFDHYFATYPNAANPSGSIPFVPKPHTPKVNNLVTANLLVNNPNNSPANGTGATDPFRLDRTQANTQSQNHAYTAEQRAVDNGKDDLFPKFTGRGTAGGAGAFGSTGQVMGYFDGNTVTAFWTYAQHFAMSDNAWTDNFGPSTVGALNVISGQTNGAAAVLGNAATQIIPDGQGGLTVIGDPGPAYDPCSTPGYTTQVTMTGKNIGDLLNDAGISWGSFMGGFDLSVTNANGTTGCARSTFSTVVGASKADYVPHHAWFQFYKSTANPNHLRPSSVHAIGHTYAADHKTIDPANHAYDLEDFYAAVKAGHLPAVSYIKMPAYQDGHAGYSDPLDEQVGNVELINFLQKQPEWRETAVIITYDDSDGWYDHQYVAPKSASYDPTADQVNGPGLCGLGASKQPAPKGVGGQPVNGRCGPGTRVPFIVVSPYARTNFVSHAYISQASVVRFVEDNWLHGKRLGGGSFDATTGSMMDLFDFDQDHSHDFRTDALFLDPTAGTVIVSPPDEHHHH